MATYIITCQCPDNKKITLQCEPQNIRAELSKNIGSSIPYDNIILIDNQDRVFSASTLFYQTKSNNQFKDSFQYKVYDAQQLYKEFRLCINMKNKNENDLIEAQKSIKNLQEKSQDLQTTQKEMERLTGEKEKQIKELQDKLTFQENEQIQLASQNTNLQGQIQGLQGEKGVLSTKIDQYKQEIDQYKQEIEKFKQEIERFKQEIEKGNQDKQQIIQQWNDYHNKALVDFQNAYNKQYEQMQVLEANKNEEIRILKEDMDSQIQKLNKLLKVEKDKSSGYQNSILDNESRIASLENQNKIKEAKIEKLQNTITECESALKNMQFQFEELEKNKDQEIKKLQQDIKMLNTQRQQLEDDKFQLVQQIQNQITDINNKIYQIQKLNTQQEEQCEFNQKLTQELHQQCQLYEKLQGDFKNLQGLKTQVDKQLLESKEILQEEQQKVSVMDQKIKDLERQKNYQNLKLEQEIQDLTKKNQGLQDKERVFKKDLSEQKLQFNELSIKLDQTQNMLTHKEEELKDASSQFDHFNNQMKITLNSMKREMEQNSQQIELKDLIIKKITNSKQDDKYQDKINGLMEGLIKSSYKIYQFLLDQNVQSDHTDCEIYEISIDYDKARQLLRNNYYFQFEDCLIKTDKGSVKIHRSIQGNVDSTFYKGSLCVVEDANQIEYKGKYLLRKEYISQSQPYNNINDAIQMAKNNLFCQMLLEQFNQALQRSNLNPAQQQIAKQFVLKYKDKQEYYYYEMVEEGIFSKVNGGIFQPQQTEEHSYFNAFSKYVYEISKRNYIITHLCLCGNYVYDMIVSSSIKGLFSPLDQGQSEIQQFLDIIDGQHAILINRHWTPSIQALAEHGFN